ncbi:hypothetical protein C2845_PM13G21960 [Panicum miliaceum]|uniref:Uncharacterized protein n=1 Tax=Panicum miliaceum TaxID=4540 RepID=A0A3L6RJG3_PANMI|nr:hypothetical protein C2845_PM13G21960 [Panicum miliaceum]
MLSFYATLIPLQIDPTLLLMIWPTIQAGANLDGWLGYKLEDSSAKTPEKAVTGLKVNDHVILPTFEISRNSHRLWRRVTLPETLQVEGEPQYHFLQYKVLPSYSGPLRASILAGIAHGDHLEEQAAEAKAAFFAGIAAAVDHDMDPEEWALVLAQLAVADGEPCSGGPATACDRCGPCVVGQHLPAAGVVHAVWSSSCLRQEWSLQCWPRSSLQLRLLP